MTKFKYLGKITIVLQLGKPRKENDWNLTLGCQRFPYLVLSPVLDSICLRFPLWSLHTINQNQCHLTIIANIQIYITEYAASILIQMMVHIDQLVFKLLEVTLVLVRKCLKFLLLGNQWTIGTVFKTSFLMKISSLMKLLWFYFTLKNFFIGIHFFRIIGIMHIKNNYSFLIWWINAFTFIRFLVCKL